MRLQKAAQGTARNSLPSSRMPQGFSSRVCIQNYKQIHCCILKLTKLAEANQVSGLQNVLCEEGHLRQHRKLFSDHALQRSNNSA